MAAEALEASVDDLEIVDGMVRVQGRPGAARRSTLGTVAVLSNPLRYAFDEAAQGGHPVRGRRPRASRPWPRTTSRGSRGAATSTARCARRSPRGMHAAIVETDPDTAEITILRYCVVHDCGR